MWLENAVSTWRPALLSRRNSPYHPYVRSRSSRPSILPCPQLSLSLSLSIYICIYNYNDIYILYYLKVDMYVQYNYACIYIYIYMLYVYIHIYTHIYIYIYYMCIYIYMCKYLSKRESRSLAKHHGLRPAGPPKMTQRPSLTLGPY